MSVGAAPAVLAFAAVAAVFGAASPASEPASASAPSPTQVTPGFTLTFPRDFGSHPAFRTEWWYATGWLRTDRGEALGFQITFFRSRQDAAMENPSAFAPRQILIAHAAISDRAFGRLRTDERIARAGFGLAEAREGDTDVWVDDWQLVRGDRGYSVKVFADSFALELSLQPTQAPLPNGDAGYSRKGPSPTAASYYYSVPHLDVRGEIARDGKRERVTGEAWLDHEWSSEALEPEAAGWDWVGLNLVDGSSLMAFRMRDHAGGVRWAAGTLRARDGKTRSFAPGEIEFTPGRRWRSSRTSNEYPVEWTVRAGDLVFALEPLMDDQESDTRRSTGAIYWEGAVSARAQGRVVGRGYLELTGYGEPLRLR